MDEISLYGYLFLWLISICAGLVDSIAGGGGLLTVPALASSGVPPQFILGTNKLQGSFGSFSASLKFLTSAQISFRNVLLPFCFSFGGAALGSLIVQQIQNDFLKPLILIMLIAVTIFFIFSPKVSNEERKPQLSPMAFAALLGTSIGFYDGFFGPGTGSFFLIAFMTLAGFGLKDASMRARICNFASNIGALLFFILGNAILWKLGLLMASGQFIGARIGATLVLSKGAKLIRPMVITVALLMCFKSLWEYFILP